MKSRIEKLKHSIGEKDTKIKEHEMTIVNLKTQLNKANAALGEYSRLLNEANKYKEMYEKALDNCIRIENELDDLKREIDNLSVG